MKTNTFRLILAILAILPSIANAQQNIIDAFDAIKNCNKAEIEETHFLQRDPETGVKIGQCDVYDFTLPKGNLNLINDVVRAINDDINLAYCISSGARSTQGRDVVLAVGDGKSNNVTLTTADCRYIYACFLAPKDEDADGNYRYAYGLSYDDDDDDDEIDGRFVITYATTMKHRQDNSGVIPLRDLSRPETWGNAANSSNAQEPWIRIFMRYVTALGYSSPQTRPTIAGYLYEVTASLDKYQNVTEQDKETARGILTTLMNDSNVSSNGRNASVVRQILKGALENLK